MGRTKLFSGATAVCLCALVGLSLPKVAAAAPAGCPGSNLCIYTATAYGGVEYNYGYGQIPTDEWYARATNEAKSFFNYRSSYASWISNYQGGPPAGGVQACLGTNAGWPDIYGFYYAQAENVQIENNLRGVLLSGSRRYCPTNSGPTPG